MDRRLFLLSTLALAGCGLTDGWRMVICDPDLAPALGRALKAYGKAGDGMLYGAGPEALLAAAEGESSALVVTRQPLLANRLQRLGFVRLEHRWQADIAGGPVEIVVTKGMGPAQWRALTLARWLASDAAAPALANPAPLFTVP
jgi:hypothetical protein